MKRWSEKTHPLVAVAGRHKSGLDMRAESIDVIMTTQFQSDIVSTIKFDGEHSIVHWKKGDTDCTIANSGGSIRTDTFPGRELAKILGQLAYDEIIFGAELYAIWEDGRKMMLNRVSHHIRAPDNETEERRQRLALFDIISINGQMVFDTYWKKIVLMNELVGTGDFVHVVTAKQGDVNVAKDMWEHDVIAKKLEGLVLHHDGGIIKVKVIHNMDLVVIGMKLSGARLAKGLATSFLVAFMAPDGRFIVSSHVGAAAKMSEQKEWYDWIFANGRGEMVVDGERHIMCEPKRIVEVGASDWYLYEEPELTALKYENNEYHNAGKLPGAKGQKPRLVKMDGKIHERKDKGVNPKDLRLTQVPDFEPEWIEKYMGAQTATHIDKPSTEDWNRSALSAIFGTGEAKSPPKGTGKSRQETLKLLFDNPPMMMNMILENPRHWQGIVDWVKGPKSTEYGTKFFVGITLDSGEELKASIVALRDRKMPNKGDVIKFTTHRQPKNGWASVTENQEYAIVTEGLKIEVTGLVKILWTSAVKAKEGMFVFYAGVQDKDTGEERKLVVEFPVTAWSEEEEPAQGDWQWQAMEAGKSPADYIKKVWKPWKDEYVRFTTQTVDENAEWLPVLGTSPDTWDPIKDAGIRYEFIEQKKKEEKKRKREAAIVKRQIRTAEEMFWGHDLQAMFGGATSSEKVYALLTRLGRLRGDIWQEMGHGGKASGHADMGYGRGGPGYPGSGLRAPNALFHGMPISQRSSVIKRLVQFGLIDEMPAEKDADRKFRITEKGRDAVELYREAKRNHYEQRDNLI